MNQPPKPFRPPPVGATTCTRCKPTDLTASSRPATHNARTGQFTVPARTVAVFAQR